MLQTATKVWSVHLRQTLRGKFDWTQKVWRSWFINRNGAILRRGTGGSVDDRDTERRVVGDLNLVSPVWAARQRAFSVSNQTSAGGIPTLR